ncbi:MAG: 30S ribosome-binding factor RbfA [bacterium]|nr:30S ribosome-binding factor RbfA [bacterium]
MDPRRTERLTEAIREELEEIFNYELSDPRVGDVRVSEVLVSSDLRQVQVRVSFAGEVEEQKAALEALNGARRHVRLLLSERLDLFRMPELRFEHDLSPELDKRAKRLLRRVRKGRPRDERDEIVPSEGQKSSLR